MDNHKIMIVGTGNVGASIAFALVNQRTAVNEIILTDIIAKDAEGEAMDLRDALAVAPSYAKIKNGTYADARDCDIVIITAGAAQKPGETRMDLLKKNVNILKGMVEQIMASGFNGIFLVVTNPMDVLTYFTQKFSGPPSEKVIGSGTAPHVLSVSLVGWPSQNIVNDLSSQGICISAGCWTRGSRSPLICRTRPSTMWAPARPGRGRSSAPAAPPPPGAWTPGPPG